jgi:microsomal epoxide hydrolase
LNRFAQFTAQVAGTRLHFVHEKGQGPAPLPLLLAHGWPDGFQRFVKLIPLLTDPSSHGAEAVDAFDVVAPSLPGYGFSPRLAQGTARAQFGSLFHTLMTEKLGYDRYGAHGGDVGSAVCDQLRRNHAAVVGVHLTNVPMLHTQPPRDVTADERDYLTRMDRFRIEGGGYMHLQCTKPWTPAAALNDSPAGLAAWIIEKFHAWSDCDGDVERRFSKDELLTNVMLFWVTETIGTSFLAYRDFAKPDPVSVAPATTNDVPPGKGAPAGFALFPKELANPPREWAERFYDVRHWVEMPAGGHFAALEEPERLAADIRTFFRPLRQG